MIRKPDEYTVKQNEHMRGGDGVVEVASFATPDEMNGKGRLFAKITIKPGCSIGWHVHEGESEIFYIIEGTAEYNDNGETRTVTAGDSTICPAGSGHGIANKSDKTVSLIALIVYA